MQHNVQQLQMVLLNTFSTNRAQQLEAENLLSQWRYQKGFASSLLQLVLESQQANTQESIYIQQAGTIFLKNFVTRNYDLKRRSLIEEEDSGVTQLDLIEISPEDRAFMRDNILKALVLAHTKIQSQLCMILQTMIGSDYPVNWLSLVDDIVNLLKSNDVRCVYAALLALDELLKSYKLAQEDHYKIALNDIVNRTFEIVTGLFQYLLSQNTDEFAMMRKLVLKVIWASFQLGTPQFYTLEVKENKFDRFNQLMEMLLESYKIEVPQNNIEDVDNPHWKVKKWIGHFTYRLIVTYSTLEVRSNVSAEEIRIADFYVSQWSVKFMNIFLQMVQFNIRGTYVPHRLITLAFRYLDACVSNPEIYKNAVASRLKELIVDIVFPYFCFSTADRELWEYDPQEWLRIGYELSEDLWNTRINAMGTLTTMVTTRRKDAFPIYLSYITEVLTNYANQSNVNPQLKDGVLYTIGNLVKLFTKNAMTKDKVEDMLKMFVFPEFTNAQHPYLRARACWVLGSYALIPFKNQDTPMEGMKFVLNLLQDKELPVKIQAGLALSCLLNLESASQHIRPILPQLLDVYMRILNDMEHSTVVMSIEQLVDTFAEDMEPYAVAICEKMAATYIRVLEADEDDLDIAEEETLMENCVNTILTLMKAFTSKPTVYRQLEPIVLPLICKILESPDEGYDFVEHAMEMLTYVTFYCEGNISENCWSILPTIYNAFSGWAYDFIGYLVGPMDNYISLSPQRFLSNPDHITMVYHLCAKHLAKDAETVEREAQGACKILSSMMQNCKGHIDSEIPKYLDMALYQLDLAETPAFTVLLLELFADAIIYNMELTLGYLESRQATLKVFTKWFQSLPSFKRVYDKKICVLAFSNIVGYPNFANHPKVLQDNIGYIVNASVKLLVDIQKQLVQIEEEKKKEAEEGDDGYGDDYDSEEDEYNDDFKGTDKEMTLSVDALKHNPHLQKLVESLTNVEYNDKADQEVDEYETFDSPLDKYDEKVYFGKAAIAFSSQYQSQFQQIISQANNEDKMALQQLMNHASQQ